MRHYTIQSSDDKKRLDQFLTQAEPNLTRNFVQKLIKDGYVFVNNKKITKSGYVIKEGDELIVRIPSIKEIGILAEDIPLNVVYEDADMVVVNKPAGMVVHPTDHGAHVSGTLVNALMHYCKDLSGIGGERRPGIVHRLDKDTSGLIMCAKSDLAHQHLAKQIEGRTVKKVYLALLKGHLSPVEGSIEAPLIKTHTRGGQKDMQVSGRKAAKYALTHYKVLEYIGDYSLVEVEIITGRTHQIRVHFASIGHPLAGDSMYGDNQTNDELAKKGLTRQFLHAHRLTFRLPKTNEEMTLTTPLAEDLEDVLNNI